MKPQDQPSSITDDDIDTLARLAGIRVAPARVPLLAAELESALKAARELKDASERSTLPGGAPFDPAWGDQRRRAVR